VTDTLPDVTIPSPQQAGSPPGWVSTRGQDCRAWDRRDGRLVWGPVHAFARPHDLGVTNGLLRCWVGPRLHAPYVHVQAFRSGVWREVGCVSFEQTPNDRLLAARLVRCTPDVVTLALEVETRGPVLVSLARGERWLRVQHGDPVPPVVFGGHYLRWRGIPPALVFSGGSSGTGKYGQGLALTSGCIEWRWPVDAAKSAWSLRLVWLPTSASATQGDSGLLLIADSAGAPIGTLEFLTASDVIRWTLGAQTLSTAALTFSAGEAVDIALAFSSAAGMAMSTKVGAGAVVHVTSSGAINPGTSEDGYTSVYPGLIPIGFDAGDGDAGDENAGGVRYAAGVIDNVQIFEDRLSDGERATLLGGATGLAGLPSPEGRLVFYVPFDARLDPVASTLTSGRRYESTVAGGATRNPDSDGLTKALYVLSSAVLTADGFAIGLGEDVLEAAAALATTATSDDLADQHAQLAAANDQQVRSR